MTTGSSLSPNSETTKLKWEDNRSPGSGVFSIEFLHRVAAKVSRSIVLQLDPVFISRKDQDTTHDEVIASGRKRHWSFAVGAYTGAGLAACASALSRISLAHRLPTVQQSIAALLLVVPLQGLC